MVKWLGFCVILLGAHHLKGQNTADSLILELDQTVTLAQLNHKLYHLVSHEILKQVEPDKSKWPRALNTIAEKTVSHTANFPVPLRIVVLSQLAEVLTREQTGGPGYTYIQKALALSKTQSGAPVIYAYAKYADVFQSLNRLDSAIYYAEKALTLAQAVKEDSTIRESWNQLAMLCYKSKNFSKSEYYLRKLINDPKTERRAKRNYLNTLALTFRNREMYDTARVYFKEALTLSIELKDTAWIGLASGNIGQTWFLQNKFKEAIPGLLTDLRFSLKKNNKMSAINALQSIITIHLKEEQIGLAKHYYDTLTRLIQGQENKDLWLGYYKTGADFYEKFGKPDSAYKNLIKYIQLNNDWITQQYNLNAAQLEAQFQFERQMRQIEELERTNQSHEQESKLKSYFLFATAIVILLVLWLLYGQYRNNRYKSETNEILRNKNEEISSQAEHLEELNATKDKLFAIIGHDLRGPINSLKMLMGMMKNQMITKEEFEVFFVKLQNNVDQVYATLDNLLSWSKTQMMGMSLQTECVNVNKMVTENFKLLNELASVKKIALNNLLEDDCEVLVDPDHLRLVLRNLVSNGIKFSNEGGGITIENLSDNGFQIISVCDSGIGMTEEAQSKLFKVTSTVSTSGTKGEKGTGIGLMLCKEVIEKNGGRIWVESEEGKGTTLKFTLPKA